MINSRSFLLITVWVLFALLSGLSSAVYGQDDHGNSPETATHISTDGALLSGNIFPSGDVDYFSFESIAGHLYTIETSGLGAGSDTFLYLFDSDGYTVLAWDDEGGDEEHASKIVLSTTKEATYYVEVSHYRLSGTGTYKISVVDEGLSPLDDHGNTPATATLIISGTPESGSIEIPGDVDYFRFVPTTGRFYDIETFNLPDDSDTFITLVDKNGSSVLAGDDQGGRETNASRIIWLGASNDSYYVSVTQFLSSTTGSYDIKITDLGGPISLKTDGARVTGSIPEPGDVDAFVFSATSGHIYDLQMSDVTSGGFRLILLDTNGLSEIKRSTLGSPKIIYEAEESASYYVLVRDDILGGSYSVSVKDTGTSLPNADFNKDGEVGVADLYLFMKVWHLEMPTPTPEP